MPAAAVILETPVTLDVLLELCTRSLGAHAPHHIFAVREMPQNAMGKTQRGRLAEIAARFLARGADG